MRISRVLMGGLFVWICAIAIASAVGDDEIIDLRALVAALLLAQVLVVSLLFARRSRPLQVLLAVLVAVLFLTRSFVFAIWPAAIPAFAQQEMTASAVSRALGFLFWGTLAAAVGGMIGARLLRGRTTAAAPFRCPPAAVVMLGAVSVGLFWIGVFAFSTGDFAREKEFGLFGYFLRFLSTDVAVLLTLVAAGEMWRNLTRRMRLLFALILLLYVLGSFLGGARGSFINVFVFWLLYRLAKEGDFRASRRFLATSATAVILTALFVFPMATAIRAVWTAGGGARSVRQLPALIQDALLRPEISSQNVSAFAFRIGALDIVVPIINDAAAPRPYLSATHTAYYVLNGLLPGVPFPEVLSQGNLYTVIYRGISEAQAWESYHSEVWTAWGIAYAFYGYGGGVAAMFGGSLLLALVYQAVTRSSSRFSIPLRVVTLFLIWNLGLTSGIDTWLLSSASTLLAFVTQLALLVVWGGMRSLLLRRPAVIRTDGAAAAGWPPAAGQ